MLANVSIVRCLAAAAVLWVACSSSRKAEPETQPVSESLAPVAPKAPDTAPAAAPSKPDSNKPDAEPTAKPEARPARKAGDEPVLLKSAEADAVKAYKKALARGRKLSNKGKHAQAIPLFMEALKHMPGDAASNSELGWSAFKVGDLPQALSATQASLKKTRTANLQAASLYNLGRIHERMGELGDARAAYSRSLTLRPNRIVSKRLAGIAPGTSVSSMALLGPYPSMAALCKYLMKVAAEKAYEYDDLDTNSCEPSSDDDAQLKTAKGPFLGVQLIEYGLEDSTSCELVIQTKLGRYLTDGFLSCSGEGAYGSIHRMQLLKSGADMVLEVVAVQYVTNKDYVIVPETGGSAGYHWEDQTSFVMYCAIEAKGVPVCTPHLHIAWREDCRMTYEGESINDGDESLKLDVISARLDGQGGLQVTGADDPFEKGSQPKLDKYKLTFLPAPETDTDEEADDESED